MFHLMIRSSPEKLKAISVELKTEAKRLGLGLVGITSPRASSRFEKYKEWLNNKYVARRLLEYIASK